MNRDEHVAWVKERALAELEVGGARGVANAIVSVASDLGKHPDTRQHDAIMLMHTLAYGGQLRTERETREFIEGIR